MSRVWARAPALAAGLPRVTITAALAVALAAFLLRERWIAGGPGFPLDDSWIHLHFARNLAEGRGFVYNPGEPVGGSTAPLWTLLVAALFALVGAQPPAVKVLGVLAALGAALGARALTLAWTGDRRLGLLAGVLAALSGPLLWGALSGMEVALAACLVTGAVVAEIRQRSLAAAALGGLAVLARPEAVVLLPLLWAAGPLTLWRTGAFVLVPAVWLAPWLGFNLATTGSPLPATAVAKVEGGLLGLLVGQRESLATALIWRPEAFLWSWVTWLGQANLALPVLAAAGAGLLARRRGRRAWPAAILLLHPLAMALLAPYRGPGFQEGRYSAHLLPLAVSLGCVGLTGVPARLGGAPARRGAAVALVLLAAGGAWVAAGRYGWAVQNIEAMQVPLGRWVAERTPPAARLALNDVGAIAYLSRREVVDLMGLVTPAIVPYRRQGEAGILRYLERRCPDYLIIFPEWFPALAARATHFTPVHRLRLPHNTVAGADEMVVYETAWNRWRPSPAPCGDGVGR